MSNDKKGAGVLDDVTWKIDTWLDMNTPTAFTASRQIMMEHMTHDH